MLSIIIVFEWLSHDRWGRCQNRKSHNSRRNRELSVRAVIGLKCLVFVATFSANLVKCVLVETQARPKE